MTTPYHGDLCLSILQKSKICTIPRLRPWLMAGDMNAKYVSWSQFTQQNIMADQTIRKFCVGTGFTFNPPLEPTHFHQTCRNTIIGIVICKCVTITDVTSTPELYTHQKLVMAKSKNHTNHNQNRKDHRNGIKRPRRTRQQSMKGVDPVF
ncbi:hypothetical protein TNIN_169971 [Trichonephila inaurata madagascariensis]|uniref:60S ribosomal protein L29 n=1 Tax=Trichonephila inaurata madagascariensis TaxID=2747483 RepID=A0A8X6XC61_9ARAC|nr:hypothetical protein TNIN_169971 [Trichonephila inaurata madagascariensis]